MTIVDENYKFRLKDFIPVIGLFNYGNRNVAYENFIEIDKRLAILALYNASIIFTSITGLEKILN